MMLNWMVSALMVLRRLEELGQQAYRALRRNEQPALPVLKEEIDEQVGRLKGGRVSRRAAGLAY